MVLSIHQLVSDSAALQRLLQQKLKKKKKNYKIDVMGAETESKGTPKQSSQTQHKASCCVVEQQVSYSFTAQSDLFQSHKTIDYFLFNDL